MRETLSPDVVELKRELEKVRHNSLSALRQSNFIEVAKLTVRAAELNRQIFNAESSRYGLA